MASFFGGGFPGGFGGFGGFGGGEEMDEERDVDTSKLYELLNCPKDATQNEIKKAYRKIAMKAHPDKGGDVEKFKEINEAYEILSNEEKRATYDKYGKDGLKDGGPGGMDDIFSMFTGGGPRRQQQGAKKTKPVMKEVQVKLEEVYAGKVVKMPIKKRICCESCGGKGGKNIKTCGDCKGQGFKIKTQMLGPGMIQQSQVPCNACRGEGKQFDEKDRCTVCKGEKIKDVEKILEIPIEKGIPDEKTILFAGEGNEMPGAMAGDLHVRVSIKPHPVFERKGADLFMKKKISLLEALVGVNFKLKQLDGTDLTICSAPADVISTGEMKVIQGKGMPFYGDAMSHGNLIIQFDIEFPKGEQIKKEAREQLKKILPGPKINPPPQNYEMMEDFHESMRNESAEGGHRNRHHDDDDGHPQGQRVECGTQ